MLPSVSLHKVPALPSLRLLPCQHIAVIESRSATKEQRGKVSMQLPGPEMGCAFLLETKLGGQTRQGGTISAQQNVCGGCP